MHLRVWLLVLVFSTVITAQIPRFLPRVDRGTIDTALLPEVSGAAFSSANPGIIWVHNDSGGGNFLYGISSRTAEVVAVYRIGGVSILDWEDTSCGPGPESGISYIYIGDFGDNERKRHVKHIIRVKEPVIQQGSSSGPVLLHDTHTISFMYPDGYHDAETLLLDPLSGDMYIVTKSPGTSLIYRLPADTPVNAVYAAQRCCSLDLPQATGGSVSADGARILIKNYFSLFYWDRDPDRSFASAFDAPPQLLPYIPEPQGEAVCWNREGNGFFTLSEQKGPLPVHLFYYPPKQYE